MSRSFRKRPIASLIQCDSESFDKMKWHRAWRTKQRSVLNAKVRITNVADVEKAFAGFNLILSREISNVRMMEKEGCKVYRSPKKFKGNARFWRLWMLK